jgi:hypothetical protein
MKIEQRGRRAKKNQIQLRNLRGVYIYYYYIPPCEHHEKILRKHAKISAQLDRLKFGQHGNKFDDTPWNNDEHQNMSTLSQKTYKNMFTLHNGPENRKKKAHQNLPLKWLCEISCLSPKERESGYKLQARPSIM